MGSPELGLAAASASPSPCSRRCYSHCGSVKRGSRAAPRRCRGDLALMRCRAARFTVATCSLTTLPSPPRAPARAACWLERGASRHRHPAAMLQLGARKGWAGNGLRACCTLQPTTGRSFVPASPADAAAAGSAPATLLKRPPCQAAAPPLLPCAQHSSACSTHCIHSGSAALLRSRILTLLPFTCYQAAPVKSTSCDLC